MRPRIVVLLLWLFTLPLFGSVHALAASGADLVPVITVYPPLVAGRLSELRLTIKNVGSAEADDVVALWTIDSGVTEVPVGCSVTATNNTYLCKSVIPMSAGGDDFFLASLSSAAAGTTITSSVTVTSSTADDHPENNTATFTGSFLSEADLAVSGTAASTLDAEGRLQYNYTITNRTGVAAQNVHLAVQAFDYGTFVSSEGADCKVAPLSFDTRANCTMADIPASASSSFSIRFQAAWPIGHFSTTATVNWGDPALHLSADGTASVLIYAQLPVTNTNDSGYGSLRSAIDAANVACLDYRNPCRIVFQIPPPVPASGWFTIKLLTPLPAVTAYEVLIDAEGQTALTGDTNPSGPEIDLSGASAGQADGLVLRGEIQTVRGLAIDGFSGNGILATPGSSQSYPQTTITGNYVGTDPTGEVAVPNQLRGVRVVGGRGVVQNNVISGNSRSAVFIDSGVVSVLDNRIGVTPSGAPLGNGASGIFYSSMNYSEDVREVRGNVIAYNHDVAVGTLPPAAIAVRENSMHDNGGIAYDIGLDGPSATPSGSGLIPRPLVTSARYDAASGDTVIDLTFHADPFPEMVVTYTLYVFATPHLNRAGYAEGETFLAKVPIDNGKTAEVRFHGDLRGQYITALAERFLQLFIDIGEGNQTASSELSDGVMVP